MNNGTENITKKNYRNVGNIYVLGFITKPGKVLDIGCGGGDNAKVLHAAGYSIDGITISESELAEASAYLNKGYLYNLENGLPEEVRIEKYDYVICSHVLEHICYPEKLLSDINLCLKTDGVLVVALPNLMHYRSRFELLKGNFNYQSTGIWDNTHFKWYTYKTGAELLENNGFRLVSKTVSGRLPFASVLSKILPKKFVPVVYNIMKKISAGFFGYQLLYVAAAK